MSHSFLGQPVYFLKQNLKARENVPRARCNHDFSLSPSSPSWSIVPASMSDLQLQAAARHRLGGRLPSLASLHGEVPLVRGCPPVTQRRCPEDERLMSAVLGGRKKGFIVDIVSKA